MEETLTHCLVRVREDLNKLKKVRDYLEANTDTDERCFITWRTIEAFNSILSVCSSQNTPETSALDTLLDSFYYLARNNTDSSVWDDFGFELGIICVKVLSAIERTDIFEILFYKLLTIISIICEHNSTIWKATARQILNVLINKKFSLSNFESVLKICVCILRNIDSLVLNDFSLQNLHLLKTLSLFVQKVGDFEIQSDIMELIFLHISSDKKLMSDFFSPIEKTLFQSLQFVDFEGDCRLYLNAINKSRREFDRKVYSICCHVFYLGGCFVEPPVSRSSIWIDANKDTERITIKCRDDESDGNHVICIQFSEILHVKFESGKTEGNRCLTIQTKSLSELHKDVKNDDICLVVENVEGVYEFVHFLETTISEKKKKKFGAKISKTINSLIIDRNSPGKIVQDHAITSSERPSIEHILPDVLSMFERANKGIINTDMHFKSSQSSKISSNETKTSVPRKSQELKVESQELSPNSFAESLNKHIGLNSPELRRTYEDSVETMVFLQKCTSTPGKTHKLFRSPNKIFNVLETNESKTFNFVFEENKENNPLNEETQKQKIKTYCRKPQILNPIENPPSMRVLRDRKNLETKLSNSQSEDYFQRNSNVIKKKKPSLPKLKRNTTESLKSVKKQENQDKKYKNLKLPTNLKSHQRKSKNQSISMTKKVYEERKIQYKLETEQNGSWKSEKLEANEPKINLKGMKRSKAPRNKIQNEKTLNGKPAILPKETKHRNLPPDQEEEQKLLEVVPMRNQSKNKVPKLRQDAKPSLLDPNGYAYQRWCKPTTSERSNFWLKKLNAIQKPKIRSDIFEFSDDTDPIFGKNEKKKRKVIYSKRKHWIKKEAKQTSLREVKKIIKKATLVNEKPKSNEGRSPDLAPHKEALVQSPESFPEDLRNPSHSYYPSKRSTSPESQQKDPERDDSEYESVISSEDEEFPRLINKRQRSDEESSKTLKKKKSKVTLPRSLTAALRHRLQMTEEKEKRYTDEIIHTVNKASNHLFNHLQRKDGEKVISYLNAVEATSTIIDSEIDDLNLRAKRIQRVVLYFKNGCSVSDAANSLVAHFSSVREAFKTLKEKNDSLKTIDRIADRLNSLIKTEIEKSIRNEWVLKRNKLLKCASILENFPET